MTVYINGKFLCQQTTGVQSYGQNMLAALRLLNIDFEILIPPTDKITDKYHVKKVGFFSNLVLWEQISLPFFMNTHRDGILINFSNSAPLWGRNQIVTIHDLAFEKRDVTWFSFFFKTWYRFLIPRICRKALRVCTVSDFSKKELMNYYKLPENKIEIIPNVFAPEGQTTERVVKEDYVLMTGSENPRKNIDWVLQRVKEIEEQGLKLVLLNGRSNAFAKQLISETSSVIVLGHVNDQEYRSLIRYCSALIYPSLYEGFGIPVLESLCMKRPVICNKLPVFVESFGNLPVYLEPEKKNCLSEALTKAKSWGISDLEVERLKTRFSLENSGNLMVKSLNRLM